MQKIVPNLWFNSNAEEAVGFYASVLPKTVGRVLVRYPETGLPDFQAEMAGQPLTAEIVVDGYQLVLINAGPEFTPNPSISLILNFDPSRDPDAASMIESTWAGLVEGGEPVEPLGEYPFAPKYGSVRDRYGVTWRLILSNPDGEPRPTLMPWLQFGGLAQNRARAAIGKYTALFDDARPGMLVEYTQPQGTASADAVMFADFQLADQWFVAQDATEEQDFNFDCGMSLQVNCADQAEIDRYWDALSAVPEAEQCGWCADEFGVAWQIVPAAMESMVLTPAGYQAMLGMKKLVIADFPTS